MKHLVKFALSVALLAFVVTLAGAQTLEDILQKHYKAQGGLDALKAKKTLWMKGKMMMGGMEMPFINYKKRPDLTRSEMTLQGQKFVQVFQSGKGWMINPMMGSTDPVDLPAEELKNMKEEADFDGYLVDAKAKGNKLELIGKEDVEGADAYHIKVTTKDTVIRHIYLDADSFLEIQNRGKYPAQGKELEVTNSFGSYKNVGGLVLPFQIDAKTDGKIFQQVMIDTMAFDVPVADSLFVRPPKKK